MDNCPSVHKETPHKMKSDQNNFLLFLEANFRTILYCFLSIIPYLLVFYVYFQIRREKKEELLTTAEIPDHEVLLCQKKYSLNHCSEAEEGKSPPLLLKVCKKLDECRNKKKAVPTVSRLIFAHLGSLVQAFVEELNATTILVIVAVLTISILFDALRNRPRVA
ncbi:hypothetical protein TRFO_04679 [Tritrichomonas foetus]|uniref:Brl1/Brr6 domain-containing protein n=1 Tax=Tritrichomonas foetus TaxID=1144522 RepID=A0A1J4KGZ1_9EUKA|nr:hypothetical protein TRFO_04679 [Tritrichomonas foetus]|eukprot:OHT09092.1 hypothetical protein TRFO_04679 [Tritrichomonas foetus]